MEEVRRRRKKKKSKPNQTQLSGIFCSTFMGSMGGSVYCMYNVQYDGRFGDDGSLLDIPSKKSE